MLGYSRGFQPVLWSVFAVLWASGFLLVPGVFLLRLEWNVPLHLPPGWHGGTAALHVASAIAATVLIGMLIPVHVKTGLRKGRQMVTGIALLSAFGLLALTGLAINYVSNEMFGLSASLSHLIVAILLAAILAIHAVSGRAQRLRR